ncbi:uncharacterized protein LOC127085132 isoform X2 [Lathyrus oleraceus]|uniref:uncharacterized protein LOC127085132 isoform X2 n=1 Tax=Pisum sativum TaxID=3888 RepID=UPI0021D02371|nr:uncharacterized protein LOC127085132 isoform X2 [Pisum sativum]
MKEKNRNMVAISLYRGNLHRTPDLPRRWLMPNPKISLKDFKSLLARRSKALSRSSNPNPNPLSSATNRKQLQLSNQPPELVDSNKPLHGSDFENHAFEKPSHAAATSIEKHTHPVIGNVDMHHDKDKRKKEVEAKLQVLNAKKHSLVLVLKQILNAEEDLKRRNSLQQQGVVMRGPSVPPKADGTNDTGSDTKYLALSILNLFFRPVACLLHQNPLLRGLLLYSRTWFQTLLGQVSRLLVVHHALLTQDSMGIHQTYLPRLCQELVTLHHPLLQPHLEVLLFIEMLGTQVHGNRTVFL